MIDEENDELQWKEQPFLSNNTLRSIKLSLLNRRKNLKNKHFKHVSFGLLFSEDEEVFTLVICYT